MSSFLVSFSSIGPDNDCMAQTEAEMEALMECKPVEPSGQSTVKIHHHG